MPPNPTGPTNPQLRALIRFLRKAAKENRARIWRYVAELLSRPRRRRVAVNLSRIDRVANDGDVVVVPGKLLGGGSISKRVTVAAWRASKSAIEKVVNSGGEVISIAELVRRNPRGSNVKIVV